MPKPMTSSLKLFHALQQPPRRGITHYAKVVYGERTRKTLSAITALASYLVRKGHLERTAPGMYQLTATGLMLQSADLWKGFRNSRPGHAIV